jgi:hypothetical protein
MMFLLAGRADAQAWSVEGQVQLGKRAGPQPVAGQWVVVHRVASDSAGNVSGGPVDSARTDRRGQYRVRYARTGGEATYIAITNYAGVSYISAPLTRENVSGDDGSIMVFDTISPPYPIRVAGRHLIITAPDTGDRRQVIEVYELLNDSTHTVIGSDTNPVWRAPLPRGVSDVAIDAGGDISPSLTKVDGEWLELIAPISPGLRQLSFSYTLGPGEFPLTMPVVDSATVFELLVQEPEAVIEGGGFTEVAGVSQEGIAFRRLLAQNVPPRTVLRFTMPRPVARLQSRIVKLIVAAVSVVMVAALAFVFWKRRRVRSKAAVSAAPPSAVESLVQQLAMMDADFERHGSPSEAERAAFDARRAELKAQLNAALARSGPPT